jgi:hypothetical protein
MEEEIEESMDISKKSIKEIKRAKDKSAEEIEFHESIEFKINDNDPIMENNDDFDDDKNNKDLDEPTKPVFQ